MYVTDTVLGSVVNRTDKYLCLFWGGEEADDKLMNKRPKSSYEEKQNRTTDT